MPDKEKWAVAAGPLKSAEFSNFRISRMDEFNNWELFASEENRWILRHNVLDDLDERLFSLEIYNGHKDTPHVSLSVRNASEGTLSYLLKGIRTFSVGMYKFGTAGESLGLSFEGLRGSYFTIGDNGYFDGKGLESTFVPSNLS
jgi:hypothetical protein